jgi:hypothetical protein
MPLFYKRRETSDEIIISFKNWIGYFLLALGLLGLFLNLIGNTWSTPFMLILVLFLAIVLLDTWKPNLEVRRAKMKNDIKIRRIKEQLWKTNLYSQALLHQNFYIQ